MLKTVGFPSTRTGDQTIIDGNLVIGTAGKGIDFSADPHPAGMTSELLDDYEEGTWTPTLNSWTVTSGSIIANGWYTKVGNLVFVTVCITGGANFSTSSTVSSITNLPFLASDAAPTCVFPVGSDQVPSTFGNAVYQPYATDAIFMPTITNWQYRMTISGCYLVNL